jgi:ADP-heptose:LPS heptosyltransferase
MGIVLKKLNGIWRKIIWGLAKNVGTSGMSEVDPSTPLEITRILICRPNHRLGNQLLITPLLQDVAKTFPNAKVDMFVKGGLGPTLFKNYDNVVDVIQLPARPFSDILKYIGGWIKIRRNKYDLVFNGVFHSASGRFATQFARSTFKCFGDISDDVKAKYADHEHAAKGPVYCFRDYLRNTLHLRENNDPVPALNLKLNEKEIANGKKLLRELVSNDKPTISIFTYATRDKLYPETWWEEFYSRLKREFPDYNILEILPKENVSQIGFKARTYYSKDVREIASVMANAEVFIGADSGMMHLAVSAQTPTLGLFKVTNADTFGPYGNNSVAIDTKKTSTDDCIKILNSILHDGKQVTNKIQDSK